mgnify:CR=1 FL=1
MTAGQALGNRLQEHIFTVTPTAVDASQVIALMGVAAGDTVLNCYLVARIKATTAKTNNINSCIS